MVNLQVCNYNVVCSNDQVTNAGPLVLLYVIVSTEFMEWKVGEEEQTCSQYVKQTGDCVRSDGYIRRIYVCHRSGPYRKCGRSIRHLKVQGSNKIDDKCPACMEILISTEG